MQPSRDGSLLLASATTTWRPLSALWSMKEFEQQRFPTASISHHRLAAAICAVEHEGVRAAPSRDGSLLLASATTAWRPLSALWSMKEFEQQ
ncbi:hypothetical protein JYU34_018253 [Plutella xylostella]|uniref:Uncharacterized protein n=1 Tax=Plutella xylostella TaxID=51655 RepID=A0ABQ7Q034_PLUXY|nr:hypothetical protein JYU34_018253 [Plutella xylostella]